MTKERRTKIKRALDGGHYWRESPPTETDIRSLLADSEALERVTRFGAVAFENWIREIKPRAIDGSDELVDLLAEARDICLAAQKELPTAADLVGSDPDFTGDLSTDEYVRELRGAQKQDHNGPKTDPRGGIDDSAT